MPADFTNFTEGLDVLLIGGELRHAASGVTFATINPATEQELGRAADAGPADMDAAIAAARSAFDTTSWSTDPAFRARCLRQLRDGLLTVSEEMRALTTAEAGAPAFLTDGPQFVTPATDLGYFADLAESYEGWHQDLGESEVMGINSHRHVLKEAAGVVGAITPWNFPHQINFAKIGPALAAGCTVVLKAAPDTPWCASAVARIIANETEFPPGVINIITSSDHSLGAQLSGDPRVDIVSFTGSTETGRKVMASAVTNITRVFLELGGKSAFVILDDADVAAAASMAAFVVSTHAGQGCAITTRLVVPRNRYDEAADTAAATLTALAAGDPTDPGTICGPLISAVQRDRVQSYLDSAIADGGAFAAGGGRSEKFDQGFYIDPTLVVGLDNTARIAREEVFGPVLTLIAHDGTEDALSIANDSTYGLSGSVWSADEDAAWDFARNVRTGTMSINGGIWYGADVPFGGYKQSGIGRELGVAGFEEYLETKSIAQAIQ